MLEKYIFLILIICYEILLINSQTIPPNILNITSKSDEAAVLFEYGKFIALHMNQSADPCNDFYQFSCGHFKDYALILADARDYVSSSTILETQYQEKLIRFLREPTNDENMISEIKMKKFYSSCVESYNSPFEKGFKKLINIIEEINLKDNKNKMNWIDINFSSSFGIHIFLDVISEEKSVINIIARPIFNDFNFKTFAKNINLEIGQDFDVIKKELKKVKQLDKMLAKFGELRKSTEILNLNEFISAHKEEKIDWKQLFKENSIVKNNLKDINKFVDLLQNTDKDTLLLYAKWRNILIFYEEWHLWDGEKIDSYFCISKTEKNFQNLITAWVLKAFFDDDRRSDLLKVSRSIQDHFGSVIDQLKWMDKSTKSKLKTKLNALKVIIGYKDAIEEHTPSKMIYEDITISDSFWKDFINFEISQINSNPYIFGDIELSPYSPPIYFMNNEIRVSIRIVQLPLYHLNFPNSLKFGGIGALIGSEISKYLGLSNFKNYGYHDEVRTEWSDQSLSNFQKHHQCLKDQANQLFFAEKRTDSINTIHTNIARKVGLKMSYNAYISEFRKKSEIDLKPFLNLNLTNKQLFFLKYGQSLCEGHNSRILTDFDKHKGGYDIFMNIPEFSEAFQCKPGTKMNPLKKCNIW